MAKIAWTTCFITKAKRKQPRVKAKNFNLKIDITESKMTDRLIAFLIELDKELML